MKIRTILPSSSLAFTLLLAQPALASTAHIATLEFSGRLSINHVYGSDVDNVNFFSVGNKGLVTGRFIFDLDVEKTDRRPSTTSLNYDSGDSFDKELNWISTEFDQSSFAFQRTESGYDKDKFSLNTLLKGY